VLKVKFAPEGYRGQLVAELWLYPDNSMLLELSTKCAPSEAFQIGVQLRTFLAGHGIESGEQATKTKKALEFFSERLRAEE
jgi:hypothetical protein